MSADIIDGAVGFIGALLSLHACRPASHALSIAMACGRGLIARAPSIEFAHERQGIAEALTALGAIAGEPSFSRTAQDLLIAERSPSVSDHDREPRRWCDGAPTCGGAVSSDCLCHGTAGTVDALLQSIGADIPPELECLGRQLAHAVTRQRVRTGDPYGVDTQGLMLGTTGVGYSVLWLAAPRMVPSVLRLDPYPANR